ncbi:hypothetical protein BLNAU_16234 [Blattamonas nauphoetae]|uniref:Uncharacterized protein n=1 Tax=Blattamonas nauphoetae TaxID=2049346 RepID=A0ABQ9X8I2_9EUKA|nr:hypothetical protein BLNAU_16234 [Blattamonas nauphoetae]
MFVLRRYRYCSPFFQWIEKKPESDSEKAISFRSHVRNLKLKAVLDDYLEENTVEFLQSVNPRSQKSAHTFLNNFARTDDDSLADFVQSIVVLISSTSQTITTAAMKMLCNLIWKCSTNYRLKFVKADLIPQLINILDPQSLSFAEAEDIHIYLISTITCCIRLTTSDGLAEIGINGFHEQQAVHETVFTQVVVPSEKYILHLCTNRFSIIDGLQSKRFLALLAHLLRISAYYPPAMDFILNMPVCHTIPSCLTFFECTASICNFLDTMMDAQWDWNRTREETRSMKTKVHQMLRMEGIEDLMEEKLPNDRNRFTGAFLVVKSIKWNNLLGMNFPEPE